MPSATTGKRVGAVYPVGIATVVLAKPMPFAPMWMVCPSRTVVRGGWPGENKYVEDRIMAAEGPSEKMMLTTVIGDRIGEAVTAGIGIIVPGATN